MTRKSGIKGFILGAALTAVLTTSFSAYAAPIQKSVSAALSDVKIMLNGQQTTLTDSSGNTVEPINYNGTIYLPIRALSKALGVTAAYDSTNSTVKLTSGTTATADDDSTGADINTDENVPAKPEGDLAPAKPDGDQAPAKPDGTDSGYGTDAKVEGTGKYTQSGDTVTKSDQTIAATEADQSAVKVSDSGTLTLTDSTITKTGDTSSEDNSNFYGLNAAVLSESGSTVTVKNTSITTDADGSNATFSTGEGSVLNISDSTIQTSQDSSRGLDATMTGTVNATNVKITTAGEHAAAIATDRGEGTVNVTGGTMNTSGEGSPGIYSTGKITVSGATIKATGSEAVVIEGRNSATVKNTSLTGAGTRGVMIYQSYSGDAEDGTGTFTMTGGSLNATAGPIFYSTNTDAVINLTNADVTGASGTLLQAQADKWGTTGSNGAIVTLNANNQELSGNVIGDSLSTITLKLATGSTWSGALNSDQKLKSATLKLDATSSWNVTANSYVTALTDSDTTLANINDNGHTIYYDADNSANSWLNGKTVTLQDGGKLTPIS
ncbi:stalk domain-containing protein [Paenibacillus sp. WLX1005]|uniref:stalk domain-containing protein n=1 Tax=Paenibacillus sp. WLX1005 TaxID=3243766 RepID=UPI0039841B49